MKLTKEKDGWHANSVHIVNGEELHIHTQPFGGPPKSACYINKDGTLAWEYPHLLGYLLGFDVKANKRTIAKAHKVAVERVMNLSLKTNIVV